MHWHNDNAVLIFWGAIAFIVVVRGYFRNQARMARYKMMETLAQRGQTIPPQMMDEPRRTSWDQGWEHGWDRHFTIGHGIMLMCIGVATSVFLWALTGGGGFFRGEDVPNWLPLAGIFPFMIGLGRVIIALTAPRWEKPKQ